MKKIDIDSFRKMDDEEYVWYLCYGSNINTKRFMIYINGDQDGGYAGKDGCRDKSKPAEARPYIIRRRIYFATHCGRWNGGVAFLNYRSKGKVYGKIYKIKKSQFMDIYKQEHSSKDYNTVLYVGKYKKIPIYTFTSLLKLDNLVDPSEEYLNVIREGIKKTFKNISPKRLEKYIDRISKQ